MNSRGESNHGSSEMQPALPFGETSLDGREKKQQQQQKKKKTLFPERALLLTSQTHTSHVTELMFTSVTSSCYRFRYTKSDNLVKRKQNGSQGPKEWCQTRRVCKGFRFSVPVPRKFGFLWVIFCLRQVIKTPSCLHSFHLNAFLTNLIYAQRRG